MASSCERPFTVIQVIPRLVSGGAERGTVEVAAALAAAGHRAVVVAEGGRMAREIEAVGGVFVAMPVASKSPVQIWRNARALQRLIAREGASLIHARSRAPAWSARMAARRTGIPFVTTFHGLYGAGNALKRMYNGVMVAGDAVIAVSQFIAQHIREHYPQAAERVRVIARGVDLTHFVDQVPSRMRLEAQLRAWSAVDDCRRIILMPARISSTKGHDVLIAALKLLRQRRDDFVCICPGDDDGRGRYRAGLDAAVRAAGLEGCVRFPGHTRDMPAAYAAAHTVVIPSTRPEPFGRICVEAQAMGRPPVAAAHGGACETVEDGVTGFLVAPNDPAALADGLDRALSQDDAQRAAMAEAGKRRVRDLYRTDKMCADTLELYASLIREARVGVPLPQSMTRARKTLRLTVPET